MPDYTTYNPSEKDKAYINKACQRFTIASGFWRPWIKYNQMLLGDYDMELTLKRDKDDNPIYQHRSRLVPPLAFEVIETEIPQLVGILLDHDPPFKAVAGRPGQDPGRIRKSEAVLAYQLRQRGFKTEMIHALQQIAKIGTQIFRLKWSYETCEYSRPQSEIGYGGIPLSMKDLVETLVEYDGPDFPRVAFNRFFIDPNTPPCDLQRAGYMIEEDIKGWDEFEEDADYLEYDNLEYVRAAVESPKEEKTDIHKGVAGPQKGTADDRTLPGDEYARDVRLLYYFDRSDVITVALVPGGDSTGILLKREEFKKKYRAQKYPFNPVFARVHTNSGREVSRDSVWDSKPGSFYPPGDLAALHGLQMAQTTSMNQRIDQVTVNLNPPLIVEEGALVNEAVLGQGWVPNRIIKVRKDTLTGRPLQSLMWKPDFPDVWGNAWQNEFMLFKELAKDASGMRDAVAGIANPSNTTMGGIQQETANAMKRIMLKIMIITKMGIEPMLTALSDMNALYLSPQTEALITGSEEVITVNPEEIVMGLTYSIRTMPPYNKQLAMRNLIELIPVVQNLYPYVNAKRFAEIIFENMEYIEFAEELIPKGAPELSFADMAIFLKTGQLPGQQPQAPAGIPAGNQLSGGQGSDAMAEIMAQAQALQ